MTLEELLAALAKTQEGTKLAEALKKIIADKDAEIKAKGKAVKDAQTSLKEVQTKEKTATERLSTVLDSFEIDSEAEDFEEAIEAAKAKLQTAKKDGTPAPEVAQLQKELSKLQRDFKKLQTTNSDTEKSLQEERAKRHTSMKNQALLAALMENKAIKPETLTKLLLDSVKVGDDDSLVFVAGDGEEIPVKDGVQSWLKDNPEFLLNNQNPGGGSGGNGAGGGKTSFADSLLKSQRPAENLQKAESIYFGGSNNQ